MRYSSHLIKLWNYIVLKMKGIYVMRSGKISWNSQILVLTISQTKNMISFFPTDFCNLSTARIFGLNNFNGVAVKGIHYTINQKNGKFNMTDFRLI